MNKTLLLLAACSPKNSREGLNTSVHHDALSLLLSYSYSYNSVVNDEEYVNCIEKNYKLWRNEYANEVLDKRVLWDLIKYRIRLFTISYCKTKAKRRKDKEEELRIEIEKLDQELSKSHSDF